MSLVCYKTNYNNNQEMHYLNLTGKYQEFSLWIYICKDRFEMCFVFQHMQRQYAATTATLENEKKILELDQKEKKSSLKGYDIR